jgi:endonuclease YncB( thermonuclease family)
MFLRVSSPVLVAMLAIAPTSSSASSTFSGIGHAKDGDSLMVGDREVRLFGIDAPEWDQNCTRDGRDWACGQVAASELERLVTGKYVSCVAVNADVYGRTVSQCTVDGIDVNRAMVARGYAVAYRHYSTAYVSAEESAKVNRRGIWAGTFEMPSLYRHEEVAEPARIKLRRARPVRMVGPRSFAQPSGACVIKGNRGAHGWIYHLPGMPYYDQTHAEEIFCTEAQARAAGYRRARAR